MRRRALMFALLYLAVIAYLCSFPWDFLPQPKDGFTFGSIYGRRQILDAALNLLFYIPLGVSWCLAAGRGWRGFLTASAIGAGFSWCVETAQLWIAFRSSTYTDLLMNSAGTAVGAAVVSAIDARWLMRPKMVAAARAWYLSATPALFVGLWLLWHTFPFVPRISWYSTVVQFTSQGPFSLLDFAAAAIGFASLRVVLQVSPWLPVCFAALLSGMFLQDRTLAFGSAPGAAVGWWFAARVPLSPRVRAITLTAWIAFNELRPFQFQAIPTGFSWRPFESWYANPGLSYYPVIFQKLFFYTLVPWALEAAGSSRAVALSIPLGLLLAGEYAQRYIPGRTPELTDSVVLLAGWTLLQFARQADAARADYTLR